jgi:thiol-disulfide isomerase/thioredoxin
MRTRRTLLAIGAPLLLVGLVLALSTRRSATQHATPAPALPPTVLIGPRLTIGQLHGHPTIVHFWASWCGPCNTEAPQLAALAGELPRDARLVGVDWSDSPANGAAFAHAHHWTFPNLQDPAGHSTGPWQIQGMPTTFILDRHARILARLTGPQSARGLLARLKTL